MNENEAVLVAEVAASIATATVAEIVLPKLNELTDEVGLTPWYKDDNGTSWRVPSRIRDLERMVAELRERLGRVESASSALTSAHESAFTPDLRTGGAS